MRVYDYIDSESAMLEHMYHKRLKGYDAIGYQISANGENIGVGGDMLFDQISFQSTFLNDLRQAKRSIIIVSPYATLRRVRWLESALTDAGKRGVDACIRTRPSVCFRGKSRESSIEAIKALQILEIRVETQEMIHQKYAIIDGKIVWYGSINLLSFGASQESIMRLVSSSIARALEKTQ